MAWTFWLTPPHPGVKHTPLLPQIKRVNGPMNAVCHTRFEEALVEARAADAAVQAHNAHLWFDAIKSRGLSWDPRGPLPPFLGVPCRWVPWGLRLHVAPSPHLVPLHPISFRHISCVPLHRFSSPHLATLPRLTSPRCTTPPHLGRTSGSPCLVLGLLLPFLLLTA